MIEILSISVAILAVALVGLVIYIFKLNKEKQFVDKDNDPDFIKLQKDYEGLDKEINLKEQYISDLKKDKQELIQSRTDVDSFKEISNKSFQEYQAVVSEYKNFHEKLTGDAKYQGRFNELKLRLRWYFFFIHKCETFYHCITLRNFNIPPRKILKFS